MHNNGAVLSVLLTILGILLLLAGLVGCILPALPGPPIAFLALIALALDRGWDVLSGWEWAILGLGVAVVTVLDFVIPIAGAKRYGASRAGIWLSIVGMIAGMIWLPPLGMLTGAFLGAYLGEVISGKEGNDAIKAAWGVFIGTIVGTGLKLFTTAIVALYYFVVLI